MESKKQKQNPKQETKKVKGKKPQTLKQANRHREETGSCQRQEVGGGVGKLDEAVQKA